MYIPDIRLFKKMSSLCCHTIVLTTLATLQTVHASGIRDLGQYIYGNCQLLQNNLPAAQGAAIENAIKEENIEEVKRLLKDFNIESSKTILPHPPLLHYAIEKGNQDIAEVLIEAGANIHQKYWYDNVVITPYGHLFRIYAHRDNPLGLHDQIRMRYHDIFLFFHELQAYNLPNRRDAPWYMRGYYPEPTQP